MGVGGTAVHFSLVKVGGYRALKVVRWHCAAVHDVFLRFFFLPVFTLFSAVSVSCLTMLGLCGF